MAKNLNRTAKGNISLAMPVPAGTKSGDVVLINTKGLKGWAQTDRATATTVADGTAAPGLADGQATVELIGISTSVNLPVAGAGSAGDKVYKVAADGTYSGVASGNALIGYALADWTDGKVTPVGLTNA
ncbi:capsid cement protein [Deinococcus actinosclerus]|uniref:DUF2190 domain-containing protein n=1 Tax=Deinococcus actinosclerus TaxID=1768108 RepID=A0ABM5X2I1_9DEIO|nr:capsid cement protein [Deinococcus actinosclerus]ALW87854.1 hypothetical protein AUC44_02215 [Deinococcus actinosclerus]